MPVPPLPPLRIREVDGAPNVIPVFELVVSNNTLEDLGGGTVSIGVPSGGAGASTANTYITVNAEAGLNVERSLTAGLGITLADSGANAGIYVQALTPFLVSSDRTLTAVYPVLSGGTLAANRSFHVDTAFLVTSAITLTASTGLAGGGNLGANRIFSINANVRRQTAGFFVGGNLSTTMIPEEARVYIPHNLELTNIWLAVTTTPVGANILVQLYQFPSPISTGSAFFSAGSRPIVATGNAVGIGSEGGTFLNTTAYAGSWLGWSLDQAGSTTAGSNLTVNVIGITS